MSIIPETWESAKLIDLGAWRGGGTPSKANSEFWENGTIPWVSPKDMKCSRLSSAQDKITEAAVEHSATSIVDTGSVLMVTRSGILSHSLPVGINLVPVALNQDIKAISPYTSTYGEFLCFAFKRFEQDILNKCRKGGTTVHSIEFPALQYFEIPLPPLNEQKRIVAKIEELFSELDDGEESLRRARRQLGVYQQSLLKQAFEGKLTATWRSQNPDLLESSDQLLQRIQSEREARYEEQVNEWEEAVEKWEADGSVGRKPSKPTKPKPLNLFDCSELPKNVGTPIEWLVLIYGELCSVVKNGISQKPSGSTGYKISRISAVRPMFFDYEDYRFIPCSDEFAEGYALEAGDLVFTRYNGARRYVGVCAHFTGKDARLYPDKLIRTRPDLPSLDPSFLEFALNSGFSRAWLETKIRTTAGQSGVSGGDVKAIPIPLCSLPEQKEIVRILDEQFTVIEQNEREIDAALKRSEALRQSILKKAFSGQLVPQDPDDEPASELLARIRAERAEAEAAATAKKKATKKKTARKKSAAKKQTPRIRTDKNDQTLLDL